MAIDLGAPKRAATPAPPAPSASTASGLKGLLEMRISFGKPRISLTQRQMFTERLSLLMKTGVSLVEALNALEKQSDNPLLGSILADLVEAVSSGKTFSAALEMHPEMFPVTYVSLVAAAEQGGFLPQVLDQLLTLDEKSNQMRSNISSALSYPVILMVFSVAVVIFVLVVIFPKFEELFASIYDQLPLSTRFLMTVSSLLRSYWLILLGVLGAGGAAAVWWLRSAAGQMALDRFKMRAPLLSDLFVKLYLNQSLGVLGLSLNSGVPITVALRAAQDVVSNSVFAGLLDDVRQRVNEGSGIASGFRAAPFIPPMVWQMLSTGEQTGKLGMVMQRIAEFYERELFRRITTMSKAVEPLMLVIMGVVVGLIVTSLILPIFKLSKAIH